MRIRHYVPTDLDALRQLHAAHGFGYPLPNLDSPLFVTKLVLEEDESGTDLPAGQAGFSLSPFCGAAESHRCGELTDIGDETGREVAGVNSPPSADGIPGASVAPSPRRGSSRIVMAAFLRLTAEAYLLHDASAGTARQRWQNLLALHEAVRCDAAARGLDDVQAFLPPRVARSFGRRLARLGWRPDPWPCFTKVIDS
jgi:hypothetical protein